MDKVAESYQLYHGDCLEVMPALEAGKVDAIICDLPYGVTSCSWDSVIPLEPLWNEYKRLIKPNGAIVLFGSQPFTTHLIMSSPYFGTSKQWFKYELVWDKVKPNGFAHAPNKPMMRHENICVFSSAPMGHKSLLGSKRMTYNPVGAYSIGVKRVTPVAHGTMMGARPNQVGKEYEAFTNYPHSIQVFSRDCDNLHPSQKPKKLLEFLVEAYTNPGDLILDNCFGSCTTGVACLNTGRRFIGIEKDPGYFKLGQERMAKRVAELEAERIAPKQLALEVAV